MILDTIVCADALDFLRGLETQSVDAIITDMPYGTTACSWDKRVDFDEWWAAVKHALKPRGVMVTTASEPFASLLRVSNLEWYKYDWVWVKTKGFNFFHAHNMPMPLHENILVFSSGVIAHQNKHPNRMVYNPQDTRIANRKWKRPRTYDSDHRTWRPSHQAEYSVLKENWPKSVLQFGSEHNPPHPTQKPVALYEYLIKTYTHPGYLICDPFMGSGTTAVAARNLGRHYIGCDLSQEYVDIANQRLQTTDPYRDTEHADGSVQLSLWGNGHP